MSKVVRTATPIELQVGSIETHCLDMTDFLGDGQTASSVTISEDGTSLLTLGTPSVLASLFTDRDGDTVAVGKGCKCQFTAPSDPCTVYVIWDVVLSGGDSPTFRQLVTVT